MFNAVVLGQRVVKNLTAGDIALCNEGAEVLHVFKRDACAECIYGVYTDAEVQAAERSSLAATTAESADGPVESRYGLPVRVGSYYQFGTMRLGYVYVDQPDDAVIYIADMYAADWMLRNPREAPRGVLMTPDTSSAVRDAAGKVIGYKNFVVLKP